MASMERVALNNKRGLNQNYAGRTDCTPPRVVMITPKESPIAAFVGQPPKRYPPPNYARKCECGCKTDERICEKCGAPG